MHSFFFYQLSEPAALCTSSPSSSPPQPSEPTALCSPSPSSPPPPRTNQKLKERVALLGHSFIKHLEDSILEGSFHFNLPNHFIHFFSEKQGTTCSLIHSEILGTVKILGLQKFFYK